MSEFTEPIPTDDEVFFKQGTIEIHFPAARGNETQLNREEAAALTRVANQNETLRKNFIEDISPLFRKHVGQEGMVQVMIPSSPYAYGGVMVVAAGGELLANSTASDAVMRTETAFDLSPDMRVEYFRQILSCIQAQEDTLLPDCDNGRVIAFENTVPSISNEVHRLPRTLALPHMHIIKGGEWINEDISPPGRLGLNLEQKIAQNEALFKKFETQWFIPYMEASSLDASKTPLLQMRQRAPYGYTIASKTNRDTPLEIQAQDLSDILEAHHTAYMDFARQEAQTVDTTRAKRRHDFTKRTGIFLPQLPSVTETLPLQPSYRTYLYYKEEYLAATISPIFITTLGAMEGMETAVDRGLRHPKAFTNEQLSLFFGDFTKRLRTLLNENEQAVNQHGV